MADTKHTPTPWNVGAYRFSYIDIEHGVDRPGAISKVLARVTARQTWLDESHANAAFIVKAVNSHEQLVAALRQIIAADDAQELTDADIAVGRAALAAAEA